MQTSDRRLFMTVWSEGALLPDDLLGHIVEGDAAVKGLTPEDYHLRLGSLPDGSRPLVPCGSRHLRHARALAATAFSGAGLWAAHRGTGD